IIENFLPLKEELLAKGYTFTSETDTEVIAHLLADMYDGDIVSTARRAVQRMRGAYALGIMTEHEPDKLVAIRLASPLVVGVGNG
ncbi:glutamine--fructose-6-phosphate aminotransferase, partial [Bacillus sp. SIMBA_069]